MARANPERSEQAANRRGDHDRHGSEVRAVPYRDDDIQSGNSDRSKRTGLVNVKSVQPVGSHRRVSQAMDGRNVLGGAMEGAAPL